MYIIPKMDILPEPQQVLFPFLKEIPNDFVLYGGTAVALRYGHRQSVDFDFFTTNQKIDLAATVKKLSFLEKFEFEVVELSPHHLDCHIQVKEEMSTVKLTLLNDRNIIAGYINVPDTLSKNNVKIASPLDLMACKILALHNRSTKKDYLDLAELIKNKVDLQKGFEACFAIAKLSPLGKNQLMLGRLKEDLQSKTVDTFLGDKKEHIDLIKNSAKQIDLQKIEKTRLKAKDSLSKINQLGR